MNAIQELKKELTDIITGLVPEMQVYGYIPELLDPPAAIVFSGSPYIQSAEQYEHFDIRLVLTVIGSMADNETVQDSLDETLVKIINKLIEENWSVEDVGMPYSFSTESNGAQYLGADLTIVGTIKLKGE